MIRIVLAVLVLSIGAPGLARADELAPGARVRVTLLERKDAPPRVGTILSLPPGALELSTDSTATTIPRLQIARIEISRGMKSRTGHGATIGALFLGGAGAMVGLLLGSAIKEETPDGQAILGVGLGLSGAVVGAGLGALIGSGHHAERWETVPIR
jgi:hypothetical protein